MGVIKVTLVNNIQVRLKENHKAVLIILIIILKVIELWSISDSEADPGEVSYFLPRIPNTLY